MMRHHARGSARAAGFTLIELMIVVAIIAILATIAYPSYRDQVRESRRTEAKAALQEVMNREQRFYTSNNTYTDDMTALNYDNDPFETVEGWYQVDATACGGGLGECVSVTATALDDQTSDACGDFTLDSRGQRSVSGSGDCW